MRCKRICRHRFAELAFCRAWRLGCLVCDHAVVADAVHIQVVGENEPCSCLLRRSQHRRLQKRKFLNPARVSGLTRLQHDRGARDRLRQAGGVACVRSHVLDPRRKGCVGLAPREHARLEAASGELCGEARAERAGTDNGDGHQILLLLNAVNTLAYMWHWGIEARLTSENRGEQRQASAPGREPRWARTDRSDPGMQGQALRRRAVRTTRPRPRPVGHHAAGLPYPWPP